MTIYEKNIYAKQKGIALIAEPDNVSTHVSLSYPVMVENIVSKSGLLTAKIKIKEDDPGIFMHSLYNPHSEAEKKVEALNFDKNTLVIVYGVGLGYHLFELKRKITEKSRVIVIENSRDIFDNLMKNVDFTEILEDKRFLFLIGLNNEQIFLFFKQLIRNPLFFHLSSNIQFLNLNYYDKLFPGISQEISNFILKTVLNTWHSLGNCPGDTILGLVQIFKNIDEALNNPGIKDIKDAYKNKPAIIVSAGPSLDKNVDLLKEVEGKAIILSTDAALRTLVKRGITPDAVLSLERILVYEQLLQNRDFEIPNEVVLVGPPLLQPEVFKEFRNNKKVICFKAGETINSWVDENIGGKGSCFMGNCVAHLAFGFALEIGANPIILIGQDLAFSETGETHGRDIEEQVKILTKIYTKPEDIVYLEDYNGKPIKSTVLWKTFLIGFEEKILQYKDRTFIDATEGGAYIKGTKVMTLRETIDKYIKHQKVKRLHEILPQVELVNHKEIYDKLDKAVVEKQRYFEEILKVSKKYLEDISKIKKKFEYSYKNMSTEEKREVCAHLLNTDKVYQLMKNDEVAILFYQGLFASAIYKVNELGLELTNENIWENLMLQEDFLVAAREIADAVVNTMEAIRQFLKAKIDKYPEPVDPDQYIEFKFKVNL